MKKILTIAIIAALPFIGGVANAAQYNAAVGNVFAFCEAPKPCNKCQPMRSYYEQLCETNKAEGQRATQEAQAQANEMQKQGQAVQQQFIKDSQRN